MTAVCSGGPSGPRDGFGATLLLGVASISATLESWPAPWAVAFASYIGTIDLELADFCAADPPAVPTLVDTDYAALITLLGDPVAHFQAVAKFQQWIGSHVWYSVCQCNTVSTPAAPAPAAPPASLPQINPPQLGTPSAGPCFTREFDVVVPSGGGTFYPTLPGYLIPTNATSVRMSVTNTAVSTPTIGGFEEQGWPNSGAFSGSPETPIFNTATLAPGATVTATGTILHPTYFRVNEITNTSGTPCPVHILVEYFCGGAIGTPATPCCPPDPTLASQIAQILDLVTLIQRQAAPFGYVPGVAHTGITGQGSLTISDLIGARVVITSTLPPEVGQESGEPDVLWNVGWLNWGTSSSALTREWITAADWLSFPAAPGAWTRIDYSLNPGVTVTITELRREP